MKMKPIFLAIYAVCYCFTISAQTLLLETEPKEKSSIIAATKDAIVVKKILEKEKREIFLLKKTSESNYETTSIGVFDEPKLSFKIRINKESSINDQFFYSNNKLIRVICEEVAYARSSPSVVSGATISGPTNGAGMPLYNRAPRTSNLQVSYSTYYLERQKVEILDVNTKAKEDIDFDKKVSKYFDESLISLTNVRLSTVWADTNNVYFVYHLTEGIKQTSRKVLLCVDLKTKEIKPIDFKETFQNTEYEKKTTDIKSWLLCKTDKEKGILYVTKNANTDKATPVNTVFVLNADGKIANEIALKIQMPTFPKFNETEPKITKEISEQFKTFFTGEKFYVFSIYNVKSKSFKERGVFCDIFDAEGNFISVSNIAAQDGESVKELQEKVVVNFTLNNEKPVFSNKEITTLDPSEINATLGFLGSMGAQMAESNRSTYIMDMSGKFYFCKDYLEVKKCCEVFVENNERKAAIEKIKEEYPKSVFVQKEFYNEANLYLNLVYDKKTKKRMLYLMP